jgi:thiamine kinase-like enzyme
MVDQFKASKALPESAVSDHMRLFDRRQAGYPRDPRNEMAPSHDDLNRSNILFDGERTWFVDWDLACLNDRYADLANIAKSFLRSKEQETVFLSDYFGHIPTDMSGRGVGEPVARAIACRSILRSRVRGRSRRRGRRF